MTKEMNCTLPKTLFAFIRYFLRSYKIVATIFIILAIVAGFWGPFNSILIKELINLLPQIQGNDTAILLSLVSLIVINFVILDNFTWRGITYIRAKFISIIINNIIQELTDYVIGKSPQFYQDNLSGKISKQITNLADGIEKIITTVAANFIRGTSLLLTAFITAYFTNPIFCFILVAWFLAFSNISILMSKKLVSLSDA